jgi:predicted nuclease with RNAse H fold
VLTVGVDLAAEASRTAVARITWTSGKAVLDGVEAGADDARLVDAMAGADKAGIDCPLGWPEPFIDFVRAHRDGHVPDPGDVAGLDWRRRLANRETDLVVRDETGLVPLSVAADRIAHPAMRCAALLAALARQGEPVDRDGSGLVVEVYPAASLKRWGLPHRRYKRAGNVASLGALVDRLRARAPWLDLGAGEDLCRRSDDAFDAVIAALTARAAARGLATAPDGAQAATARTEGWIALPLSDDLDALLS